MNISQTILDYVMQHKEGVLTSDAREDQRWDTAASILQQGVREAICVPMQGRYDVVGVIYIDTLTPAHKAIVNAPSALPRRAFEADGGHRPSSGAGGGRHDVLLGHGAGRTVGGDRANDRHRCRTTSKTFCRASAAAVI